MSCCAFSAPKFFSSTSKTSIETGFMTKWHAHVGNAINPYFTHALGQKLMASACEGLQLHKKGISHILHDSNLIIYP